MNTLYRIHTEATGDYKAQAIKLTAGYFQAFNVTDNQGYWNGQPEASITIEIYGTQEHASTIYKLAETIRKANNQDAVLVATFRGLTHLSTNEVRKYAFTGEN